MNTKVLYPMCVEVFGLKKCVSVRNLFGDSCMRSIETALIEADLSITKAQEFVDSIFI